MALTLEKTGTGTHLILRTDSAKKVLQSDVPDNVRLQVAVEDGGRCTFSFALVDATHSSQRNIPSKKGRVDRREKLGCTVMWPDKKINPRPRRFSGRFPF